MIGSLGSTYRWKGLDETFNLVYVSHLPDTPLCCLRVGAHGAPRRAAAQVLTALGAPRRSGAHHWCEHRILDNLLFKTSIGTSLLATMSLCDRNLSIGIFAGFSKFDPLYVDIKGDRVVGLIGQFYDRFWMPKQR